MHSRAKLCQNDFQLLLVFRSCGFWHKAPLYGLRVGEMTLESLIPECFGEIVATTTLADFVRYPTHFRGNFVSYENDENVRWVAMHLISKFWH
jgi:hypothetical protein